MVGEGYRSVSRKEAGARRHGCDSLSGMANKPTRRNFLLTAPIAAAAASPFADTMLRASTAAGQGGDAPLPIQVFTAADMAGESKGVQADPQHEESGDVAGDADGDQRRDEEGGEGVRVARDARPRLPGAGGRDEV